MLLRAMTINIIMAVVLTGFIFRDSRISQATGSEIIFADLVIRVGQAAKGGAVKLLN